MKFFTCLSLILGFSCSLAFGQQDSEAQTLLGNGLWSSGGYGGPWFQYTTVNGQSAMMTGGFGGWFANERFTLGGGGLRLTTAIPVAEADRLDNTNDMRYSMNYGGLYLGYTMYSDRLIHPEVTLMLGSGQVSQRNDLGERFGASNIMVAAPGLQADINVASFFRVGLGANYRLITGANTPGVTNRSLGGPSGYLTLKFGYFGG